MKNDRIMIVGIKSRLVSAMLVVVFGLMLVQHLAAQTFKTLHKFNNGDGAHPRGLILSDNTLYGTTDGGGGSGYGTVFKINTDGTGFKTVHSFTEGTDGGGPVAGVVLSGNILYGTTIDGTAGYGNVFAVDTAGKGFTNLYDFSGSDGDAPHTLLLSGGTLYGTTGSGGDLGTGPTGAGSGTVFAINTDGSGFVSLYSFSGGNDGYAPYGGLVLSNSILFGITHLGGTFGNGTDLGNGTVFAINTDGTGFTTLYSFTAPSTNSSSVYTNSDGADPAGGLLLSRGSFYGVTEGGGRFGSGTIFRLQPDGSGFTNLYNFPELLPSSGPNTNSGGAGPFGALSISGRTLYGTTRSGGIFGNGTVFAINTDGTGFTNLYNFTGGVDGAVPFAGLLLSRNTMYGTTYAYSGYGTVFSLSFAPQLSINPSGPNVVLSWPTNYAGFDYTGYTLQSTTNLSSPVWTTNLPAPVVVDGLCTLTNPISGTQQFYRLDK